VVHRFIVRKPGGGERLEPNAAGIGGSILSDQFVEQRKCARNSNNLAERDQALPDLERGFGLMDRSKKIDSLKIGFGVARQYAIQKNVHVMARAPGTGDRESEQCRIELNGVLNLGVAFGGLVLAQ